MCSILRTSEQSFVSVYLVSSVSNVLCNRDCLLSIIYVFYLWEMASDAGRLLSLDNMHSWEERRAKAGEVNSTKAYIANDKTCG
jgi:hypothetical protein